MDCGQFEPAQSRSSSHQLFGRGNVVVALSERAAQQGETGPHDLGATSRLLRLEVIHEAGQPSDTRLVATDALSRGLGPQCLPTAIESLVRREAANGDKAYVAGIAVDIVQAAYEADRFGHPLLSSETAAGIALGLLILAALVHRVLASMRPPSDYVPSENLVRSRAVLEGKLVELRQAISELQVGLTERQGSEANQAPISWWEWLNLPERLEESRKAAMVKAATSAMVAKLSGLKKELGIAEQALGLNDKRFKSERMAFERKRHRAALMARAVPRAAGVLAVAALALAASFASLTVAAPSRLMSPGTQESVLIRPDTLIALPLGRTRTSWPRLRLIAMPV